MEVMCYALYCGELIFVGYFCIWLGLCAWIIWYMLIDVSNIWLFMVSFVVILLVVVYLYYLLVFEVIVDIVGFMIMEHMLVRIFSYVVFVLVFVFLIFGGTIYCMIEWLMMVKIVFVLGYLLFLIFFMVLVGNMWEVVKGFF